MSEARNEAAAAELLYERWNEGIGLDLGAVYHLVSARDGKVSHIHAFFEREAAIAAAEEG